MILTAKQILGLPVYTKMGQSLGKVISFEVDAHTHTVNAYLVKSSSIIARLFQDGLLIHTEQVIAMEKDRMIVQDTLTPIDEPLREKLRNLEKKSVTAEEVASYSLFENPSLIQSRVLALLQYFDILDYPLTTAELFQWLPSPLSPSLSSIEEALKTDTVHKDSPTFKDGFWCLAGRESIVEVRRQRYVSTEQKYQFLRPFLWIMKHLPFVKSIFVTNTLSYDNAKDESDIDLFLVCAKDKIWTVRFWCLVFLTVLRRRPSPSHAKKNMICANFLVSESKLELESIAIKDNSSHAPKDIHLAHLLTSLVPLYDPENNMLRLLKQNSWVDAFLRWPASLPCLVGRGRAQRTISGLGKCIKNFLEWICNPRFIERLVQQYQLSILPTPLREGAQRQDTNVVISDTILKFHLNDRREEIWTKWNTRLTG